MISSCIAIVPVSDLVPSLSQFHPSGTAFVTASEDNFAKLFDLRSDQEVMQYTPPESEDSGLTSCVLGKSGRHLFAGHADSAIYCWDVLKGDVVGETPFISSLIDRVIFLLLECLGSLQGHESRVTALTISPNGIAVGSASWDQNVRIWL